MVDARVYFQLRGVFMPVLYSGPTGSGKTTKLLEKYIEVCQKEGTDQAWFL